MPKIIALIGLPGTGKTTASLFLEELGFKRFSLGDITREELKKRSLITSESNEKLIRNGLRKKEGMDAFAKRITQKIEDFCFSKNNKDNNIILEGIISFEEAEYLKSNFGDSIIFIALESKPELRIRRLSERNIRPLTKEDMDSRDKHQLNQLNMKKSIENADIRIQNDSTLAEFKTKIIELLKRYGF